MIIDIRRQVILHGRRDNQCWFEPSIAVVPLSPNGKKVVMIKLTQLTANDIGPCHFTLTDDMGKKWTPPFESQNLFKIQYKCHLFLNF